MSFPNTVSMIIKLGIDIFIYFYYSWQRFYQIMLCFTLFYKLDIYFAAFHLFSWILRDVFILDRVTKYIIMGEGC